MTDVQDSQSEMKEKVEEVSANGTVEDGKSECKRVCSVTKGNSDVTTKSEIPNGYNGEGDSTEEKDKSETKLNGTAEIDAAGDNTDKKISDGVSENKINGSNGESVGKEDKADSIVPASSADKNENNEPGVEKIQDAPVELQKPEETNPTDNKGETEDEPKAETDSKPIDTKPEESQPKPESDEIKTETSSEKPEAKEGPEENKSESLPTSDIKPQESKSEEDSKSVEKSEEKSELGKSAVEDTVEKMEVDEPDNAQESIKAASGDEKSSALNNPCRVVLVKVEENQDSAEANKAAENAENANKGSKRKHSTSEDETAETDSPSKKRKSDGDGDADESDAAGKKKKIKLDEDAEAEESQEGDQQSSPSKDDGDSARKSRRVSAKAKDGNDEEQSPSTRRSSRSSVKNQASPEAEKSPSKRSRQSTPNSTPRKSVTPSPKSSVKKEDSPDEKSASESDKTPQKSSRLRSNPKPKRSLELDEEEDGVASKRQRRSTAGKTPKVSESNDEGSDDEESSPAVKKGRGSRSKATKPEDSEADAEEETTSTRKGRKSRKSRASTATPVTNSKLDEMKALLKAANLRINNYSRFWKDCNTDEEKAEHVVKYLRENGLEGEPTIENCKLLRKKIETEKELAALDKSNVLDTSASSENTRVTRSRRSVSRRA